MDFTEVYKHTAGLVAFSPGAQFILTAIQDRLIIRRADSFEVARTWQMSIPTDPVPAASTSRHDSKSSATSVTWITHAGWSADSEYVLAAAAKKGIVNVYKLRDESWSATIEAGAEGLAKVEWAPDGRTILCFSDWGVSGEFYPRQCALNLLYYIAEGNRVVPCHWFSHTYSVPITP